ncbi:hypothetical protein JTB14_028251 [Gonioctena quinquepunctata]|nr:hypothetical protein JTB14_028251 [Gonioctena quinquepunctata]
MLNDKIEQLKNVEKVSTTYTAESKKVMEKVSYAKKTQQTSAPIDEPATSRGVAGSAKIPEVTEKQLSHVLLETETRKKCNDYINLANHNEVAADNGEWKQVVKKRTRRQLVIDRSPNLEENISPENIKGGNEKSSRQVITQIQLEVIQYIQLIPHFYKRLFQIED